MGTNRWKEWCIREPEKQQQQEQHNKQENAPKKIKILDIDIYTDICHGDATLKIQSYYDN